MEKFSTRLPYSTEITVAGRNHPTEEIMRVLAPRLSDERFARLNHAVENRTFNLIPVLEGLSDPGNINAVLRSAEALGCGAAHLVALQGDAVELVEKYAEGDEPKKLPDDPRAETRISQGAEKWMHVTPFVSVEDYAAYVRERGFRIVVTALREDAVSIASIDFSAPTALVIGNERDGVSQTMLDAADEVAFLPIDGLVQSYNVSVAAALALYQARLDRIARLGRHADMTELEREVLLAHYVTRAVNHSTEILKRELGQGTH